MRNLDPPHPLPIEVFWVELQKLMTGTAHSRTAPQAFSQHPFLSSKAPFRDIYPWNMKAPKILSISMDTVCNIALMVAPISKDTKAASSHITWVTKPSISPQNRNSIASLQNGAARRVAIKMTGSWGHFGFKSLADFTTHAMIFQLRTISQIASNCILSLARCGNKHVKSLTSPSQFPFHPISSIQFHSLEVCHPFSVSQSFSTSNPPRWNLRFSISASSTSKKEIRAQKHSRNERVETDYTCYNIL